MYLHDLWVTDSSSVRLVIKLCIQMQHKTTILNDFHHENYHEEKHSMDPRIKVKVSRIKIHKEFTLQKCYI